MPIGDQKGPAVDDDAGAGLGITRRWQTEHSGRNGVHVIDTALHGSQRREPTQGERQGEPGWPEQGIYGR